MGSGRAPVGIAVLVFIGACVLAFIIGSPPLSPRGDNAAHSLLTVWRQSRMATFVVESAFTRTLPDGAVLKSTTTTVQHPPDDRLVVGQGSAAGRLGGKVLRCVATPDGSSRCLTGADAEPYDQEVDREVTTLGSYVLGDRPPYAVIELSDGRDRCFRLDLRIAVPAPPYGNHALFCFDRTTGAPSLTILERTEATDRTQATAIRGTVAPADLEVPTDTGAIIGGPAPTTTTTVPTPTAN